MNDHAPPNAVALETTLLLHGVPRDEALALAHTLQHAVRDAGAEPCLVGVHQGQPTPRLTPRQLDDLLNARIVAKANTSNLGVLLHRRAHAATTVSTTMEIAAAAGIRLFATGGLGGVHRDFAHRLDVSADLAALARFPVAVVASGVKSLLDVESTREALETLGVPVVGFRTDAFPAFYTRESPAPVDARFDDEQDLADFIAAELRRTRRGVLVCHPIAPEHEIDPATFDRWLAQAQARARQQGATGRDLTPAILAALHELSGGHTLRANIALVRDNASLAGRLAARLPSTR